MNENQIMADAVSKHGLKFDITDYNIAALVRYANFVGYNEGFKEGKVEDNISPEQVERYRAAFKCLELAQANKEEKDFNLIDLACEYGAGINLTREECIKLLNMKVQDVINLEI